MSAAHKQFLKEVVRVFLFAFIGAFLPLVTGFYNAPDWNALKAAAISAILAAVAAGVKATTDFLTKGVAPAPNIGILSPSVKK